MSAATDLQRTFEQGVALHRAGRLSEAEQLYRVLLEHDPRHEHATFLVAAITLESGRPGEAASLMEGLVARHPDNPVYFTNLGEAYRRQGRGERAVTALARALALKPDLPQAHFNLGLTVRKLGELVAAIQAFDRAVELKPDEPQFQHALARALLDDRQWARALGHFQCALVLSPKSSRVHSDYARCLRNLGRLQAAASSAARAVELDARSAAAHHEHSLALAEQGQADAALKSADAAIALEPSLAPAHCARAAALADLGELDGAISSYRQALLLDPNDHLAHSNLLFLMAFQDGTSARSILDEATIWAERHGAPLNAHARPHENVADPARKLRIGYVSSNFNQHCQALFTLPLLEKHDRSRFELYAYSTTTRSDDVTSRLRTRFDHWRDLAGQDAAAAARVIRDDRIDILVDLTMHMSVSALRIFACKPAPVQIAWLAYPGTTGLPAMDYRITDRHLDAPDVPAQHYSEAPLVLPDSFWCYDPDSEGPAVSSLPAAANGYVTFGCLNTFWKLNDATLRRWAEVMARTRRSRLLLLAPEGSARARIVRVLETENIAAERIEFVSRRPRNEYLKLYQRIDICLDTLPYNGHTTSLDAFWMGVPVVTLVGKTVAGRAGLCQAYNLALPALVAETEAQFVVRAIRLATNLDQLAELRAGLRQRLERSPLMDAERFARNLEARYRDAWRRWCDQPRRQA